VDVSTDFDTEP